MRDGDADAGVLGPFVRGPGEDERGEADQVVRPPRRAIDDRARGASIGDRW
jgi:hypothetical protein